MSGAAHPVPGLVSVIIPVYNRASFLREAVESALAQSWPSVEVILADDGSTDSSGRLADQLAAARPDVIRVLHNPHGGPGVAREAGRQVARGEFIQYLDSDDRLLPAKFAIQIAALRQNLAADIAYGAARLIGPDGAVLQEPFKWTARAMPHLFPALLVDRWWCTHTPLYRRTLCDRIGPWSDLRFSQDWEYDARAGALGVELAWVDQLVSEHRHHGELRQTGDGRWLAPPDQVRFFGSLHRCAVQAGVSLDGVEMHHFARWVFAAARRAGGAGDARSAAALLGIAEESGGGNSPDLKIFRLATRLLGWRATSGVAMAAYRLSGRKTGRHSLQQSWMDTRGPSGRGADL